MAKYINVTEAIKVAEDMRKVAEIAGNVEAFEMLIQFLKDREIVFQTPDESSPSNKGIRISNVVQNGSGSNSITISGKEVGKNLRTAYVDDGNGNSAFINCISEEAADKLFGKANDKITGRYGDKSINNPSYLLCPACHTYMTRTMTGEWTCSCGYSKISK